MLRPQRTRVKNQPKSPKSPISPLKGSALSGNEVSAKKRLVEQFYMPKSEGSSKTSSYSDLVTAFRQGLPVGESPGRELRQQEQFPWSQKSAKDLFAEKAQEGKLEYPIMDGEIRGHAKAVELLLGVDEEEEDIRVLDRMVSALEGSAQALERRFKTKVSEASAPREQLEMLSTYLADLSADVSKLHKEISDTTKRLKSHFRSQLQVSVEKLDKLDELLQSLSARLDESRNRMQNSKEVMTVEMADKIAVLEYVAQRFRDHDQTVKKRRLTQSTFLCSFIVVLACVYSVFGGFGFFGR